MESGQIEADADVVCMLHRDDDHDQDYERPGEMDILIRKSRLGTITPGQGTRLRCQEPQDRARFWPP